MRHLSIILAALALPSFAAAQSAGELGDPSGTVSVPPPPGATYDAVPPPPTAGETRDGLSAPPMRMDPEIAALRDPAGEASAERPGPHFGNSFGGAWAGFGIGSAAGALLGGAIAGGACASDGSFMCPVIGLMGAGFGALSLAPLGAGIATWAFGEARGGTGNGFAAIGMAYLGAAVGGGLGGLVGLADSGFGATVGIVAGILLTNLGAAAGYQLSSHGSRREAEDDGGPGPMVVPLAGATDDGRGFTVGAAGTF